MSSAAAGGDFRINLGHGHFCRAASGGGLLETSLRLQRPDTAQEGTRGFHGSRGDAHEDRHRLAFGCHHQVILARRLEPLLGGLFLQVTNGNHAHGLKLTHLPRILKQRTTAKTQNNSPLNFATSADHFKHIEADAKHQRVLHGRRSMIRKTCRNDPDYGLTTTAMLFCLSTANNSLTRSRQTDTSRLWQKPATK